jgi:hypothetical protein
MRLGIRRTLGRRSTLVPADCLADRTAPCAGRGRASMSRLLAFALRCAALVLTDGARAAAAPVVRISQFQSVGTHNRFHVEPSPTEKALRAGSGLVDEATLGYSFAPLWWQFDREDVRQV